ncbi:cysteine peptidase family C39 domain-containing protein [candidate division CSSED10-310 bacterium]|uniref:Cysteine peptidase family C39 domain-containing protein n=1 Tax=candidate division CSSED10-310 bacterium TaxID=2855610 RepID=A0ABV6Z0W4_UNCC1
MRVHGFRDRHHFFAPEVIQTSAMDCGPASLKCLLEGFGIRASYGRLREACQTDVDGTSINTIEEIAVQLGLDAEQIMIPPDHVLIPAARALPAIAVVANPNNITHFVVVWRCHGSLVQIMDPANGRRWETKKRFLHELYRHHCPVPAASWREWAASAESIEVLQQRFTIIGSTKDEARSMINQALEDPTWKSVATLDAVLRMLEVMVRSKGIHTGKQAIRVLQTLYQETRAESLAVSETIPAGYWSVRPDDRSSGQEEMLILKGSVLVRIKGKVKQEKAEIPSMERPVSLSPELAAALTEPPARPGRELFTFLRADGLFTPAFLILAFAFAAGTVVVEALLFRGLLDVGQELTLVEQRLFTILMLLMFLSASLLLELPILAGLMRIGRGLECRLRIAFQEKIPRLTDQYFRSRLVSDMAQRCHSVYALRAVSSLGGQFLRTFFELILTALGILWLDPKCLLQVFLLCAVAVLFPLIFHSFLAERDLKVKNHTGALSRFYLDALLGLIPIRSHGAEKSVRREHENLLVEWARSVISVIRVQLVSEGFQSLMGFGLVVWLLFDHCGRVQETGVLLLLIYWSMNLPVLGQSLAGLIYSYPAQRNITLRLLEPLGAPERTDVNNVSEPAKPVLKRKDGSQNGVSITMENVSVVTAGHTILQDLSLTVPAGTNAAIIGPSGAGKTSLVGILLGWHRAASGHVLIDDEPLSSINIETLRKCTAWVDPSVQLWNRSLLENLKYGSHNQSLHSPGLIIEQADLLSVLETLPSGLQTPLGESGALVSGGEGQRVRFGRALFRTGIRLVILDEPFRGLDRGQRRKLLLRARKYWHNATLLCITHDVGETQDFDHVYVLDQGKIIENGSPISLSKEENSRYSTMLDAEKELREGVWSQGPWRKLWLDKGSIQLNLKKNQQI